MPEPPQEFCLYLLAVAGPHTGLRIHFHQGSMVIGRDISILPLGDSASRNPDIALIDSDVAPRHALLEAHARDKIFIKDLASAGGTWVNGARIREAKLKDGDTVRVGNTVLKFQVEEQK